MPSSASDNPAIVRALPAFPNDIFTEPEDVDPDTLAVYSDAANGRLALTAYRQLLASQEAAEVDILRLMRTARAFNQSNEYQRLARLLLRAGHPTEARETLDDGIARGMVARDWEKDFARSWLALAGATCLKRRSKTLSLSPSPRGWREASYSC